MPRKKRLDRKIERKERKEGEVRKWEKTTQEEMRR